MSDSPFAWTPFNTTTPMQSQAQLMQMMQGLQQQQLTSTQIQAAQRDLRNQATTGRIMAGAGAPDDPNYSANAFKEVQDYLAGGGDPSAVPGTYAGISESKHAAILANTEKLALAKARNDYVAQTIAPILVDPAVQKDLQNYGTPDYQDLLHSRAQEQLGLMRQAGLMDDGEVLSYGNALKKATPPQLYNFLKTEVQGAESGQKILQFLAPSLKYYNTNNRIVPYNDSATSVVPLGPMTGVQPMTPGLSPSERLTKIPTGVDDEGNTTFTSAGEADDSQRGIGPEIPGYSKNQPVGVEGPGEQQKAWIQSKQDLFKQYGELAQSAANSDIGLRKIQDLLAGNVRLGGGTTARTYAAQFIQSLFPNPNSPDAKKLVEGLTSLSPDQLTNNEMLAKYTIKALLDQGANYFSGEPRLSAEYDALRGSAANPDLTKDAILGIVQKAREMNSRVTDRLRYFTKFVNDPTHRNVMPNGKPGPYPNVDPNQFETEFEQYWPEMAESHREKGDYGPGSETELKK